MIDSKGHLDRSFWLLLQGRTRLLGWLASYRWTSLFAPYSRAHSSWRQTVDVLDADFVMLAQFKETYPAAQLLGVLRLQSIFGLRYKRIDYPFWFYQWWVHGAITIEIDTIFTHEFQLDNHTSYPLHCTVGAVSNSWARGERNLSELED